MKKYLSSGDPRHYFTGELSRTGVGSVHGNAPYFHFQFQGSQNGVSAYSKQPGRSQLFITPRAGKLRTAAAQVCVCTLPTDRPTFRSPLVPLKSGVSITWSGFGERETVLNRTVVCHVVFIDH